MDTQDGGWTVIQRRFDGTIDFSRPWNEYKEGFGSVHSSYWIGNDVIHQLTKNRPSLYVSITLTNGTILYQKYETFSVSDETDKYRLYLAGSTEGTLGDSLHHHKGMSFSTSDLDNDMWSANCAAYYGGGWWFNSCHHAYLNGPWSPAVWSRPWYPTVGNGREIKETLIMIKPH
ncbi:ficolin-1-like [Saccostrea echinata]|uniref:ficolin-1-like n=1 Tax=Saccostrea echinata TaxID=191078 RepID=UPI002A809A9F|nr:ficolin-1-like [Saccostrea echinata]